MFINFYKNKNYNIYWELSKPDITLLVIITAFFGYYAGIISTDANNQIIWKDVIYLIVGVALSSAGVSTLNGYLESNLDKKMKRTLNRPIPSGKISSNQALFFGLSVSILGVLDLYYFISPLAGVLSFITLFLYLLVYTPLKQKTEWNTIIGAIPGALPPIGGWVAATGEINFGAWIFFALLFAWQIPHFIAIAWIYRDDYKSAGYKMITTGDNIDSKIKYYIGIFSILVLIFSIMPSFIGISGIFYLIGTFITSFYLLRKSYQMIINQNRANARKLLFATIIYYPALLILFVLDHILVMNF
mgnify:FL=1|tara:strand:- start:5365 stop:6270 length:906 start_codon:yes stop_codon:yes gene_type:complete